MLFAKRPVFKVALQETRLVVGQPALRGKRLETHVIEVSPADKHSPAWLPAVKALSTWLREKGVKRARAHVLLGSQLVRWQLLDWQPLLTSPRELDAYARLRFRSIYGSAADHWRLAYGEPSPGYRLPACATDDDLLSELADLQVTASTEVESVTPYFSVAFDRWRRNLGQQTAWFGVAEPGAFTIGLLHKGVWHALRSARQTGRSPGSWRDALPVMQAQIQLCCDSDLFEKPLRCYVIAYDDKAESANDPQLIFLADGLGGKADDQSFERLAWGS